MEYIKETIEDIRQSLLILNNANNRLCKIKPENLRKRLKENLQTATADLLNLLELLTEVENCNSKSDIEYLLANYNWIEN